MEISDSEFVALTEKLRQVKQDVFNEMVEGNGRQPAEVVELVAWKVAEAFKGVLNFRRPYFLDRVIIWQPDYEPNGSGDIASTE